MTPEEKIEEALREFASCHKKIRDILDPQMPKWREAVDRQHDDMVAPDLALWNTLHCLRELSNPEVADDLRCKWLARIVAIAEAQTATEVTLNQAASPESLCVEGLVTVLCGPLPGGRYDTDWYALGSRAAQWLAQLVGGAA